MVSAWLIDLHGPLTFWVGAREFEQGSCEMYWLKSDAGNGQGENVHLSFWDKNQPDHSYGDCVLLAPSGALAMGDCGRATGMAPLCKI